MTEQEVARAFDRIEDLIDAAGTADELDEAMEKAHDASEALQALRRYLLVGDPNGLDHLREATVNTIARALDYPSVYAEGPRRSSLSTAERVMDALADAASGEAA